MTLSILSKETYQTNGKEENDYLEFVSKLVEDGGEKVHTILP
jgi:hypothetical protein